MKKRLVIFNPYNNWDYHLNFEAAVYHNSMAAGHDVLYLGCGFKLPSCDLHWRATSTKVENRCETCHQKTALLTRSLSINYSSLSQYISHDKIESLRKEVAAIPMGFLMHYEYLGVNIYKDIVSSVHSELRANRINGENEEVCAVIREYILFGVLVKEAATNFFEAFRPDVCFLFNGRMAPTSIFLSSCLSSGIRVVTHERGTAKGTIQVFENTHCLSFKHFNREFDDLDAPLKPYEVSEVALWLNQRQAGKNLNWRAFVENKTGDVDALLADKSPNHKIWALFTSSGDEISAHSEYGGIFKSQEDWILKTISYVSRQNSDEIILIIRVHPNSAGKNSTGRNEGEKNFYRVIEQNNYKNVIIVSSETEFNSYDLVKKADLVLCYSSTIAIESAARGVKTIVAGISQWWFCRGVFAVKSEEMYDDFLHTVVNRPDTDEDRIRRLVYAYRLINFMLNTIDIKLPFLEQLNPHQNRFLIDNTAELQPGQHPSLDDLCSKILGEKPLFSPRRTFFNSADLKIERDAIQEKLEDRADGSKECLFTIVVPCFNYGKYISACLDSILAQRCKSMEVIVIDDGSTDDSRKIIEKYLLDHPDANVTAIFQENSGQPAIPRNSAIAQARGEYILPLDADDTIDVDYLENVEKLLGLRPEVDVVYADWHILEGDVKRHISPTNNVSCGKLAQVNLIPIASVFRRTLWERSGGYQTNVRGYEDWELWLRMASVGAIFAKCDGFGLIYNGKEGGLGEKAKENHEILYAQIIMNNVSAYEKRADLINWARNKLLHQS